MDDVLFDEEWYLDRYPDVARAVALSEVPSGRHHFLRFGRAEGRPGYGFDAEWYGRSYPSARQDVERGLAADLRAHYEGIGRHQGFLPRSPPDAGMAAERLARFGDRPLGPVIVTHIPRSGSTVLMDTLSRHPRITVANHHPNEVKVATYYAHAAHVLTSRGNHEMSGAPTEFMRAFYGLSFNPFNHAEFAEVFSDKAIAGAFFDAIVPARTLAFCRGLGLDYYRLLADDQGKPDARYFAEKCELSHRARWIVRRLFPEAREVVLVRDLRDTYCSYRRYFRVTATAEDALGVMYGFGRTLLAIKEMAQPDVMFVRYEDCVREGERTMREVYEFLGLEMSASDAAEDQGKLFKAHATSASPERSIGRWRQDLAGSERTAFDAQLGAVQARFAETFGYEP